MKGDPIIGFITLGLFVLALVGFVLIGFALVNPVAPHPKGNCTLWIADATPSFVCVERSGKAEVWKLHRDGSWQDIGPATDSNLGVPKA